MSVESEEISKLASVMAKFPIQPVGTAIVAVAPAAIVPGSSGEPALVGVPTVSSCEVEMAAVWELTMVMMRSPATDTAAGAAVVVGAAAIGVSVDEGIAIGVVLLVVGKTIASASATGVVLTMRLLVEVVEGVVVLLVELLDSWRKSASKLVVDVDVDDVVGDTGDPFAHTYSVTQVVNTSVTVTSSRACRCACP